MARFVLNLQTVARTRQANKWGKDKKFGEAEYMLDGGPYYMPIRPPRDRNPPKFLLQICLTLRAAETFCPKSQASCIVATGSWLFISRYHETSASEQKSLCSVFFMFFWPFVQMSFVESRPPCSLGALGPVSFTGPRTQRTFCDWTRRPS